MSQIFPIAGKCAAASLDTLASTFNNEMLPILIPELNRMLFDDEWEVKEAGILALGAVAEGCYTGVEAHLPELIPFLLQVCDFLLHF